MKTQYLTIVFFILFATACTKHQPDNNSQNLVENKVPPTQNDGVKQSDNTGFSCHTSVLDSAWACMEKACMYAKGSYDQTTHSCECTNHRIFTGWANPQCIEATFDSTNSVKSYRRIRVNNIVKLNEMIVYPHDFSKEQVSIANSLFQIRKSPTFNSLRTLTYIPFNNDNDEMLKLMYMNSLLYLYPANPFVVADQPQYGYYTPYGVGHYSEYYLYSNYEMLLRILTRTDHYDHNVDIIPTSFPQFAEVQKALQTTSFVENITLYSDLGCLASCKIENTAYSQEDKNIVYKEVKLIAGGDIFKRQLLIYNLAKDEFPIASVIETPGGEPTALVEHTNNSETSRVAAIYNMSGKKLEEINFEFDKTLALSAIKNQKADILLCDGRFNHEWTDINLVKKLVRGPLMNDNFVEGKSFWGWLSAKSRQQFYSGLGAQSSLGYFDYDSGRYFDFNDRFFSRNRFEDILSILVSKSDLLVAPMEPQDCLENSIGKAGIDSQFLPRVINYPDHEFLSQSVCKQRYSEIDSKNYLWILGAGINAQTNYQDLLTICPHSIIDSTSKIIVGALTPTGAINIRSNTSREFVDIYANGVGKIDEFDDYRNASNTAFSAARVARVAALIIKKWPQLKNEDVRIAILLGADVDPQNIMPARSLGSFNEDMSFEIAEDIAVNSDSVENIIDKHFKDQQVRKLKKQIVIK